MLGSSRHMLTFVLKVKAVEDSSASSAWSSPEPLAILPSADLALQYSFPVEDWDLAPIGQRATGQREIPLEEGRIGKQRSCGLPALACGRKGLLKLGHAALWSLYRLPFLPAWSATEPQVLV